MLESQESDTYHLVPIGRPVVFSLAAEGEAGVRKVLQMLRDEFELTMALSGCTSLKEITRNHIVTPAEQNRITPRKTAYIDSTVPAKIVFAQEVKKLQAEQFKTEEQVVVTLQPLERDHACVVGCLRKQKAASAAS
ncbi:uncharacterized protein A4U43_C01F30580 [Asparagus officinalis]|uniref:FMN-dependent dehydrogenase domain-containing protein n=1 Tax=Asparagus officinalis TaxID=4686 RepID=A0A5P1FV58_ASPOF|nr:uncharacterized protein A4U43_C01F30580 [Asparagus officinalis]